MPKNLPSFASVMEEEGEALPSFDEIFKEEEAEKMALPSFDEIFAEEAKGPKPKALAPLPNLPKPKLPKGLNPEDQGPLDVATPWGKPGSTLHKATEPLAKAANWMSEGMVSGPSRIQEGYKTLASRDPQVPVDKRLQGMADVLEGTMEAGRPLAGAMIRSLPGMLKEAPKWTLGELAVGTAGPPLVKEAATALGVPEGAGNLAAAVTGAAPLGMLAKKSLTPQGKPPYTEAAKDAVAAPSAALPPSERGPVPDIPAPQPTSPAIPPLVKPPLSAKAARRQKQIQKKLQAKPKVEGLRQPSEALTDESGELDIDKLFATIKSAKERFFPEDPLSKRARELKDAGKISTGAHEAYTKLLRSTHPAWQVQEAIMGRDPARVSAKLGEGLEAYGIPLEKQPAALLESMSGTLDKIDMDLEQLRELLYPYRDIFKDKEALQYGIRERHAERGAHPFTDEDGTVVPYKLPGGETLEDNAKAMAAFEAKLGPEKMKRVHEAWDRYRLFSNVIFTRLMDAGVISRDFYDNAMRDNQKFVPFQRLEFIARELDNNAVIPVGRKATAVGEKEFQNFMKGSEAEILNPMMGLVRNVIRAERAIASNNARKALAGLKELPGAREWIIEAGPDGRPKPIVGPNGQRIVPAIPLGYQPVSYLVDGRKHQVLVPKDVAAIYSKVDEETANMVTKMMGNFSNLLRIGVTTYPGFWAGNMARDYWTALQTEGLDPVAWAKGMVGSLTRDIPSDKVGNYLESLGLSKRLYDQFAEKTGFGNKLFDEYRKSGAGHSGTFAYASLPKQANRLLESKATEMLRGIADIGSPDFVRNLPGGPLLEWSGKTAELIPRLAVYNKKIKQGKTPFEAGFAARNATINFAIGGSAMDQFYRIQAFLKGRSGASRTGIESAMKHPMLTALRLGTGLGLPGAALYYSNVTRFPEVWDSLEEDVKRNHLIYIEGNGKDAQGRYNQIKSVRLDGIPAAFYGALIGGLEIVRGADPGGWLRNGIQTISDSLPVGLTRKGQFSFNELASAITPSFLSTAYSLGAKKDLYTGRDLERQPGVRQDAAPEERYNLEAKTPMVDLAKAIKDYTGAGISPHVLENVPKTLMGHWGRFTTDSMPTVGGDSKTTLQRMGEALKLQPFTKPLPAKRELELQVQEKVHGRGNRYQDYQREAERILRGAKTNKAFFEMSKASIADLIQKYPERPPASIAEEFMELQKRFRVSKAKNFTPLERSIYLAPPEVRAELIMDALRQLPAGRRASFYKSWRDKGIVTPRTERELQILRERIQRKESAPVMP